MISFRELVRRRYVRRGVIVFAVLATALGSGVAYAAWTSTGTGSATTKAGTAQAPGVAGGAVTSGFLYPGSTGDAVVVVTNPNPYRVQVVSVVQTPGSTAACAVSLANRAPGTLINAGGSATITLSGAVSMGDAADTCQGASITIPVTVTIASA